MKNLIEKLKNKGVAFHSGLNDVQITDIEAKYNIEFPPKLREFYALGVPYDKKSFEFPQWADFSESNVKSIRKLLDSPKKRILNDVEKGFWLKSWGEKPSDLKCALSFVAEMMEKSPKLIPVFSHRYTPMLDGIDDPPIISTVGRDTIFYGNGLEDYLRYEFLGSDKISPVTVNIPFWSDLILR